MSPEPPKGQKQEPGAECTAALSYVPGAMCAVMLLQEGHVKGFSYPHSHPAAHQAPGKPDGRKHKPVTAAGCQWAAWRAGSSFGKVWWHCVWREVFVHQLLPADKAHQGCILPQQGLHQLVRAFEYPWRVHQQHLSNPAQQVQSGMLSKGD